MVRFDDLALFDRAAALGSFSDAAREAGLLPGQVSAAIQRLERELGIRLFARSTRSLRLTAEGERYLPHARAALDSLRAGQDELRAEDPELRGVLQVATPSDLGRNVLLPWLAAFRRQHPKLVLRLFMSDRVSDVFKEPIDVAVRYGPPPDASFVALPLATLNRRVLVASPGYVQRCGQPASVDELAGHACLTYALSSRIHDRWTFFEGDERVVANVRGPIQSDDGELIHRLALDGEGIAYKSWLDVGEDVRAGRLVQLLPQLRGEAAPLHLVCPHRGQYSAAVQQLHALLRQRCEAMVAALPSPAAAAPARKTTRRPGAGVPRVAARQSRKPSRT
ncbi:LysR substrate-binding domain-containing protein [Xenophilus aerolatus]|nr:LysR family transcriptional regulator [Xenophilus aerolatus]